MLPVVALALLLGCPITDVVLAIVSLRTPNRRRGLAIAGLALNTLLLLLPLAGVMIYLLRRGRSVGEEKTVINVAAQNASSAAHPTAAPIDYAARPGARPRRRWAWGVTSLAIGVANPVGYLLLAKLGFPIGPLPGGILLGAALAMLTVPAVGLACGMVALRGPSRASALAVVGLLLNGLYVLVGIGAVLIVLR